MEDCGQPKYYQLVEEIRRRITKGELKRGDRLPSLAEAQAAWGISRTTMERAHTLLERDGLVVRQHGRGTFITLPHRPTVGSIGFLNVAGQQPSRYPYWAHLLEGVRAAATKARMEVLLLDSDTEAVRWEKVDGVIAAASDLRNFGHFIPVTMPRVALMQHLPNVASVMADEYHGIRAAVEHLISLGHRRIGFLTLGSPLRVVAFQAALMESGVGYDERLVRHLTHLPAGVQSGETVSFVALGRVNMSAWLNDNWEETGCTALLTQNDETALGTAEVLRSAGYRVPEDLSIIGFDGTEVAEYCSPPLTTVDVPLYEIGATSAELLLRLCREEEVPQTTVLPTRLKIRETTLAPSSRPAS
jgi:DNA-binding LacI/PurR family transcriptional regulator